MSPFNNGRIECTSKNELRYISISRTNFRDLQRRANDDHQDRPPRGAELDRLPIASPDWCRSANVPSLMKMKAAGAELARIGRP